MTVNAGLIIASLLAVLSYMLATETVNWLRAVHRSDAHAILSALRAGFQLVAVVGLVWLTRNPIGFLWGMATADAVYLLAAVLGFRVQLASMSW